jgi:hypothetical protein
MTTQANPKVLKLTDAITDCKNSGADPSIVEELKRLQVEYGNLTTAVSVDKPSWPKLGLDQDGRRVVFV